MNNCNHQFIKIRREKTIIGKFQELRPEQVSEFNHSGILVVCVYCGQTRMIYPDGKIIITKENGEVTRKTKEVPGDTRMDN